MRTEARDDERRTARPLARHHRRSGNKRYEHCCVLPECPDQPVLFLYLAAQAKRTAILRQLTTLQHQIEQMLQRLYGRKSEQFNPNQMMFDSIIIESLNQNQDA
jgi:hypothetical protein